MRAKKEHDQCNRLFAVGNQYSSTPVEYPLLADLPSAAKEARNVAALYSSKNVLVDVSADIAEITRGMEQAKYNPFRLAFGNQRVEPNEYLKPLLGVRSKTAGKSYESNGALQAADIYKMSLVSAQLVVLSACQTGIESTYRGEGAISLALGLYSQRSSSGGSKPVAC